MSAIIEPVYKPVGDRLTFDLGILNAEISSGGQSHECVVQANMMLVPDLRLCLSAQLPDLGFALSVMGKGLIEFTYGDGKQKVQGIVNQTVNDTIEFTPNPHAMTICPDRHKKLTTGKFHILNFPAFWGADDVGHKPSENRVQRLGGIVLEHDDWIIEIQQLPEADETIKKIKTGDPYGVTHVGKVSKKNGKTFSIKDFERVIREIHTFLSFVRGLWVPVILPVGFDKNGNKVFEDWSICFSTPWQGCLTWFDYHHAGCMQDLYAGFVDLLRDEESGEAVRRVLYWYIQSNRAGKGAGVDGGLILSQAALECLAYICLKKKKNRERAGEFLHRMCKELGLPTGIPKEAVGLLKAQRKQEWEHALHAVTDVRNDLVHPKGLIDTEGGAVIADAWRLSQWYISLSLLKLAGYNGKFSNTYKAQWVGEVEDVPWKKS